MKTDDICKFYATQKVDLTIRMLEDDEDEDGQYPMILIEGKSNALKMLAEILLAVSDETVDGGFFISPFGAGSAFFSKSATLGIYIHSLEE